MAKNWGGRVFWGGNRAKTAYRRRVSGVTWFVREKMRSTHAVHLIVEGGRRRGKEGRHTQTLRNMRTRKTSWSAAFFNLYSLCAPNKGEVGNGE